MDPSSALLPSPLLGAAVWQPVAQVLTDRGWPPVTCVAAPRVRTGQDVLDAFLAALPTEHDLVVVPHSNAGVYVPEPVTRRRVVAAISVDAVLPPRHGHVPLASTAFLDLPLVDLVRADLPARVLHPFLQLGQELIDQPRPCRRRVGQTARPTSRDMPGDRVMGAAGQLPGRTQRPGQIKRFQNFHDLPCRLHGVPSRVRRRFSTPSASEKGAQPRDAVRQTSRVGQIPMADSGQFSWPPAGSFVAAYGQFLVAAVSGRQNHSTSPL